MNKYKSIIIKRGPKGWGGPLTIVPTQVKNKILVVTTDGFPPLAKYIANLTGCELIDGFKIMVPEEEVVLSQKWYTNYEFKFNRKKWTII